MAEFTPVRMVSKDGTSEVIASTAKAKKTLQFSSGYRVAKDQTNLTGPALDNGQLVEPVEPVVVGAVLVEDAVVADGPAVGAIESGLIDAVEGVVVDAPATEDFAEETPAADTEAVESAPATKTSSRKR